MSTDPDSCHDCPMGDRVRVRGTGAEPCRLMVVGTAPSTEEEFVGMPFEGKTSQVIKEAIFGLGLSNQTYYTNILQRRPVSLAGDNRRPTNQEMMICGRHLDSDIRRLKPDLILAVGSTPLNYLMGQKIPSIKLVHGLVLRVERFGMLLSVMPVFDPAYVARSGGLLSNLGETWVTDLLSVKTNLEVGIG